jgi:hypothetical protein
MKPEQYITDPNWGTFSREFRRLRNEGWLFKQALRTARDRSRLQGLIDRGLIALAVVPDCEMYDDSYLGTWDMSPRQLEHAKKKLWDRIEREGVWGIVSLWRARKSDPWEEAGSCWSFVGDGWLGDETGVLLEAEQELDGAFADEAESLQGRATYAGVSR